MLTDCFGTISPSALRRWLIFAVVHYGLHKTGIQTTAWIAGWWSANDIPGRHSLNSCCNLNRL